MLAGFCEINFCKSEMRSGPQYEPLEAEMPSWLGLSPHVQEDRAYLNRLLSRLNKEGTAQTAQSSSEDWSKFYLKMKLLDF